MSVYVFVYIYIHILYIHIHILYDLYVYIGGTYGDLSVLFDIDFPKKLDEEEKELLSSGMNKCVLMKKKGKKKINLTEKKILNFAQNFGARRKRNCVLQVYTNIFS